MGQQQAICAAQTLFTHTLAPIKIEGGWREVEEWGGGVKESEQEGGGVKESRPSLVCDKGRGRRGPAGRLETETELMRECRSAAGCRVERRCR